MISLFVGYSCLSLDSYIKPQLASVACMPWLVVYLLIPTSNHNVGLSVPRVYLLFISWFLHQTTTLRCIALELPGCLSLDSYIKPQLGINHKHFAQRCLSLDSYIKPQLKVHITLMVLRCLSLDSYIKPQPNIRQMFCKARCLSLDSYIKPQPIAVNWLIISF